MEEIEYIHNDADYIIYPYVDMSQSGPMRLSRELGSYILVPILDGAVDQLRGYENKYLFNSDKIKPLFNYINNNFKK